MTRAGEADELARSMKSSLDFGVTPTLGGKLANVTTEAPRTALNWWRAMRPRQYERGSACASRLIRTHVRGRTPQKYQQCSSEFPVPGHVRPRHGLGPTVVRGDGSEARASSTPVALAERATSHTFSHPTDATSRVSRYDRDGSR